MVLPVRARLDRYFQVVSSPSRVVHLPARVSASGPPLLHLARVPAGDAERRSSRPGAVDASSTSIRLDVWLTRALFATAAIIVAVFVAIAFYARPQADDFDYAVFHARYGFLESQVRWYLGWNGRYFFNVVSTVAMTAVDPLEHYWVLPLAVLLTTWGALFCVLRSVQPSRGVRLLGPSLVGMALILLNSPARADAYYWSTGAALYPLANASFVVFCVVVALLFCEPESKKRWKLTAAAAVLAFVTIGCNETSMVVLDLIVIGACVAASFGNRKLLWNCVALLALCAVLSLVVTAAPGNDVRMVLMRFRPFANPYQKASGQTLTVLLSWITNPLLLATTLLVWPMAGTFINEVKVRYPVLRNKLVPLLLLVLTPALTWASIFPSWWSKGGPAIPRTLNVTYTVFLLGWFLAVGFFASLTCARFAARQRFSLGWSLATLSAVLWALLSHPTLAAALKDLREEGPAYYRELGDRYALLATARQIGMKEVLVAPIRHRPANLFVEDVRACKEGWPNSSYAEFFGLRNVRLPGDPQRICSPPPPAVAKVVNPYSLHLFREPNDDGVSGF
jgi:hypothetical protein